MNACYTTLAFFPIIVLLVTSLLRGVKVGVYSTVLFTTPLFFIWGGDYPTFFASGITAFISTLTILMIIFGAVFLYHVMEQKKYLVGIQKSLSEIHPDLNFRFFFVAFFMTAFFESVAGFGTPGAIVPALLLSLGFSPLLSVSVVLLIDGLVAMSGAVGTPVTAGLAIPLELSSGIVGNIYLYAAIIMLVVGAVIVYFINRQFVKTQSIQTRGLIWILYFGLMIPSLLLSYFMRELTGLVAAMLLGLFSYFFLFRSKKLIWKPWIPYWVLIGILILPKFFPWLASVLSLKIEFTSILGTNLSAGIQPLNLPLIPFLLAGVFALYRARDFTIDWKPIQKKTFSVFLILFPSLLITELMLNGRGGDNLPSMIEAISMVFVTTGDAYPVLSPYIGVLGAFVSGSTTVSNIIFGPMQFLSALTIDLNTEVILSLQLVGASLGNAICLFNIIAAGAVAGIKDYKGILKQNLLPVAVGTMVAAVLGYLLLLFKGVG